MKTLTPQELIDLPGAGRAEKHLRRTGRWRLTALENIDAAHAMLYAQAVYPATAMDHIEDAIMALEQKEH